MQFDEPKLTQRPPGTEELFGAAFYFAVKAHEYQFRRGTGSPYIDHPIRVAGMLLHAGAGNDLVVAGFLHDVLENTSRTLEDIKSLFGDRVAEIVESVTEIKAPTWKETKQQTIDAILRSEKDVLMLLFMDKLDNVRSIKNDKEQNGEEMWTRFSQPKDLQIWYYRQLQNVFNQRKDELNMPKLHAEFNDIINSIF